MEIRADLHMHGPIGFQPYWLRKQSYAGKNLLQLIADECFSKGITICAITSQADEIPKGSVHDRLGCLRDYEAGLLPKEYCTDTIGNDILVVEMGKERVYLVNGQTAMPKENGKKYDLLIVGSNRVPNFKSFRDTLNYGKDHGLIQIAEHPYVETHRGMGKELLERYIDDFDAIEGHNSQAIFWNWMTKLPKIGSMFSRAGRKMNELAQETAKRYNKPWIATSDAHQIEDLGISYISWDGEINNSNEDKFFSDLKNIIRRNEFDVECNYESVFQWFKWIGIFQIGCKAIKVGKFDVITDAYTPSNELR